MGKQYKKEKNKVIVVSEPEPAYGLARGCQIPVTDMSEKELLANTMSVDAYFDELISLVRKDYENL
jgi:hypothetical protein